MGTSLVTARPTTRVRPSCKSMDWSPDVESSLNTSGKYRQSPARARASALRTACALASVSAYSRAGSLSATIPAPACTITRSRNTSAERVPPQRVVGGLGRAPRARAGDRTHRHLAAFDPDQHLGRAADEREVVEPEIEEVGCRVERAEAAVQAQRVHGARRFLAARQ